MKLGFNLALAVAIDLFVTRIPRAQMTEGTSPRVRSTARKRVAALVVSAMVVAVVGGAAFALGSPGEAALGVGGWAPAASMAQSRYNHTATLLQNGRVVVNGGNTPLGVTASTEVYDPILNVWTPAPSASAPRNLAKSVRLASGDVLVVGGGNPSALPITSAERYSASGNSWSPAGTLTTDRFFHTATLLSDGRVLATGGYSFNSGQYLSTAEVYDPSTNTWSSAGSMATPRADHSATLLPSGRVLVVGGDNGAGIVTTNEIYDPISNSWASASPSLTPRGQHTAQLVSGKVLVAAGANSVALGSSEMYDEGTDQWIAGPSLTPRYQHATAQLADGDVLITGGVAGPGSYLASAERFDAELDQWAPTAAMASARQGHSSTTLLDGRVLIAGGFSGTDTLASAELYSSPDVPSSTPTPCPGTCPTRTPTATSTVTPTGTSTLPPTATATFGSPTSTPANTTLSAPANPGDTEIQVASAQGFHVGDLVTINPSSANEESAVVTGFGSLKLDRPLQCAHATGEFVEVVSPFGSGVCLPTPSPTATHTAVPTATATPTPDCTQPFSPPVAGCATDTPTPSFATVTPVPTDTPCAGACPTPTATSTPDCAQQTSPPIAGCPTGTPIPTATVTPTPDCTHQTSPPNAACLDSDGDGVPDFLDNCPGIANADQLNTDAANTALNRPGADPFGDVCDGDIDGDGYTNAQEIALGKDPALYCPIMRADVDGDGAVSILDLTKAAQYFAQSVPPAPERYKQDADFVISILDLTRMAQVFTQNVTACP